MAVQVFYSPLVLINLSLLESQVLIVIQCIINCLDWVPVVAPVEAGAGRVGLEPHTPLVLMGITIVDTVPVGTV